MWIIQGYNVISVFVLILYTFCLLFWHSETTEMNQDVEEAAGHSKTLRPESALHSCVTMKNDQDMDDPGNMSSTSTQTNAG